MGFSSKVEIQLDTGFLDVSDTFPLPLQYSIDDIRKIEKKNTAYSKTIVLPGTKNNNFLLGQLFDINQDFSFFNPNIKTNAKVLVNSTIVIDGFLKLTNIKSLKNVDLQGNEIQYEVAIFSEATNFFTDVGNKLLNELDFSSFTHDYTFQNISNSWTHSVTDVYAYPMAWKEANDYQTADFNPSIFHKSYLKKISEEAGYELGGSFMDETTTVGTRYAREIIPYNGDKPVISAAEVERRNWRAGITATASISSFTFSGGISTDPFPRPYNFDITNPFTFMDDDTTLPNFDPNGHFNLVSNEWTVDKNGKYSVEGQLRFEVEFDSGGVDAWMQTWFPQSQYGQNRSITTTNVSRHKIEIRVLKNGVLLQAFASNEVNIPANTVAPFQPVLAAFRASNNWNHIQFLQKNISIPNVFLNKNDVISYEVRHRYVGINGMEYRSNQSLFNATNQNNIRPVTMTMSVVPDFNAVTLTNLRNNALVGSVTDGDSISLDSYIPAKVKQKDVISDLVKRFNLYIQVDPDNKKKLLLNTRNDFYASGETRDWTQKKDYSSEDKISLLSELQNKEMLFTYTKGSDTFNKNYFDSVGDGEIYGQKKVEFDNEFVKGTKKIQTPFVSTPLVYDNVFSPEKVVPAINALTPKSKMRTLYFGGMIDTINLTPWDFDFIDSSGNNQTSTFTQYPYAGHYDNPFTPTYDINFGEVQWEYYDELQFTTPNNLFNLHWSQYVNQINEGRLVTSKFHLTEQDISFIKDNLNTKIFVKDSFYFINKIVDYNPVENGLTTVELLKIVTGVPFEGIVKPKLEIVWTPGDIKTNVGGPIRGGGDSGGNPGGGGTDVGVAMQNGNNNNQNSPSIVIGDDGFVGVNSPNAIIIGNDGNIGSDVLRSGILGSDDGRIESGVSDSWIIASPGKTITEDNEVFIGDLHIKDGVIVNNINKITGPQNELRPLFPNNNNSENKIVGPLNELRSIDYTSSITRIVGPLNSL